MIPRFLRASATAMPKAAIDENADLAPPEYEVRTTWKSTRVGSPLWWVQVGKQPAKSFLSRFAARRLHLAHYVRAHFRAERVHISFVADELYPASVELDTL